MREGCALNALASNDALVTMALAIRGTDFAPGTAEADISSPASLAYLPPSTSLALNMAHGRNRCRAWRSRTYSARTSTWFTPIF